MCVCARARVHQSWPEKEMSVLWEIPGCQRFILFCAGMKHQRFPIPGKMGKSGLVPAFLRVSPFSCQPGRQYCTAHRRLRACREGHRGLPAGQAAQGVSRESLMKSACWCLLLTGKQLCIFKADYYCILFSYVLTWNFILSKANQMSLSFQLITW